MAIVDASAKVACMWMLETVKQMRFQRQILRDAGGQVAIVPTMGALHAGHLSLIEAAKRDGAEHIVVSIYVNPTQFAPTEDLEKYPRQLSRDLELCEAAGAAGVFAPGNDEMYPPDVMECAIDVPAMATTLEGEHRPTHFAGVCRVVMKLFNIVQPDVAYFGEKDYQQLKVIEAMVDDMMLPIHIKGCTTVRESDGLAMSSRNQNLDAESRRVAIGLIKALEEAKTLITVSGEPDPDAVEAAMRLVLKAHRIEMDYAVVRHPRSLAPLDAIEPSLTGGVVALIAAKVGDVRLIDNILIKA
jgi:pantoate--beta-alanine ligase